MNADSSDAPGVGSLERLFLGPHAENYARFEELLLDLVRDHAYWRRNFHPEDVARVRLDDDGSEGTRVADLRTRRALLRLSADLKRAVPFHSPRYVGHMNSDLLMPGVLAKMVTTLYNPNNVSEEAAPVTLEYELEVGRQLARMFGLACEEEAEPCAWGHLTSGGTTANYEALWNFRSVRFYGLALQAGLARLELATGPLGPLEKPLAAYSKWELLNLSIDGTLALRDAVTREQRAAGGRTRLHALGAAVREERIETLGTAGFFQQHADVRPPVVLVPTSAHYSWEKGMKVLGLGTRQLWSVAVDRHMRMDAGALAERLDEAYRRRIPVLAVVAVLGSTEYGTVDPVHRVLAERERRRARGCDFGVHVDAAWGGYLAAIFRRADGGLVPREELRRGFTTFPSADVYGAFAALGGVDSITVDPHKAGYLPYAAGAFVARNRRIVDLLQQRAAYVFDLGGSDQERPYAEKLRGLGQYILEGSKSGASAAAVHVVHEVLPLDESGFGRMLARTVRNSETFHAAVKDLARRLAGRVRVVIPVETDTNLVCMAFNPEGNRSVGRANRFGRALFEAFRVDPTRPIQDKEFIGSYTSITAKTLSPAHREALLEELGLDPATFVAGPCDDPAAADHLFVLRHTLMNPRVLAEGDGAESFAMRYLATLERRLLRMVAPD